MGGRLVLMRHGQSEWNKRNYFTGWVDVPLSPLGIEEALKAGEEIKHIPFDTIYTSTLIRAQMTLFLAMSVHDEGKIPVIVHDGKQGEWAQMHNEQTEANTVPVICDWRLNERMYGDLQGLNKDETRERYGADQVKIWRRSFDTPPPAGESLEMTAQRAIPYFRETVVPKLAEGKNVLVSAHGNSLRAIIMHLDDLSPKEVLELEIPTGKPIFYTYKDEKWKKG
ncbi:MAG: 2,3-bisphosphoglycerate-dependent phosphoglycerate mutase [Chlamydiia bacterium]|nr:2,3-bisphosphoglycerate-dependent phosphoglycerate mutase [Chlamydiia bacterium]MCH9616196.1 2,3-bisphosphoglycerate-dependent phosphoglycerate mutase [Chlamydiia bacterium]MCH9629818.1 2,3-bisphosphoglycerate-dependent phosphoglycerate mutase [Chlamydiia bacterium]